MVHLFTHLVLKANHKDGKWKGIPVKRGQLITGRKKLSSQTGISERSIRTCLKKLESTSELTIKATNKFSIITICNYNEYQDKKESSDQQSDQLPVQQPTNNRPASDHKQELKETKKPKEVKHKYGEFQNVLLTEKQYKQLSEKFNGTLKDKIENLSLGIESKGYKYKNHHATILAWDRKEKKDNRGGQNGNPRRNSGYVEAGKKDYRS